MVKEGNKVYHVEDSKNVSYNEYVNGDASKNTAHTVKPMRDS